MRSPLAPLKTYKSPACGLRPSTLLYLPRQPVHPLPHVGPPDRQPHPHPARNRDHRRASAFTTAAASAVGIEAGIRTRASPANSTSIAGARRQFAAPIGCGAAVSAGPITTCANPSAELLSCGLVLMALTLVRPSSGMRMVVFGVLLAAVALLAMNLGFKSLLTGMSGPG